MTHQSRSNSVEDVALGSPSCSNSTESSQVYSLPLGLPSQIDICNEDQRLVSILNDLPIGPNPIIIDSNGVKIGTDFNVTVQGDAHFHTNLTGTEPPIPIPNGSCTDERAIAQKSAGQKIRNRFRYFFVPSAIVFLLLLLVISLIVFRKNIFTKAVIFPPTNPETDYYISGHPVYSKANWGALEQKKSPVQIPLPTSVVIISHSATEGCANFNECANRTQSIQYEFLMKGHKDIGYNFLIGGEGGIYLGRGWEYQNSIRAKSIAIAFIGDFNKEFLSQPAEDAAHALVEEGVKLGKFDLDYKLVGENQTSPLRNYSPGWNLAGAIRKWDHYFPGTML